MAAEADSPPFFTPSKGTSTTRFKRRAQESPPISESPSQRAPVVSQPLPDSVQEIRDMKKIGIDKLMDISYMVSMLTQDMKDPASVKCIKDIREALILVKAKFATLCNAYERINANQEAVESTAQSLGGMISALKESKSRDLDDMAVLIQSQIKESIRDEVKIAIKEELRSMNFGNVREAEDSPNTPTLSFSEALKRKPGNSSQSVNLAQGVVVPVSHKVEFSIVPKESAASMFKSSADVEQAVFNSVTPTDFGLKVSKIIRARSTAVRISAEKVDLEKLKSCKALRDAGLEVKLSEKMQPRLIVIGAPATIEKTEIPGKIILANNLTCSPNDIKVVHMFASKRNSGNCNIVIEVSPDVRKQLLALQRIYIGWNSCRVEDHVLIRQCFKCLKVGHLSGKCPNNYECCSKCTGAHDSRSCRKQPKDYKCANCLAINVADHNHCATDVKACTFLLSRIKRKVANTSY